MYRVTFIDSVHGEIDEEFDDFQNAADFWQDYADTPTCEMGRLTDLETGEVIWDF